MVYAVRREQENRREDFPRLSSMLWDTFTGNEAYRDIFMRGAHFGIHVNLARELVKAIARRTK